VTGLCFHYDDGTGQSPDVSHGRIRELSTLGD
jgi:hypothetical protein